MLIWSFTGPDAAWTSKTSTMPKCSNKQKSIWFKVLGSVLVLHLACEIQESKFLKKGLMILTLADGPHTKCWNPCVLLRPHWFSCCPSRLPFPERYYTGLKILMFQRTQKISETYIEIQVGTSPSSYKILQLLTNKENFETKTWLFLFSAVAGPTCSLQPVLRSPLVHRIHWRAEELGISVTHSLATAF